MKVSIIMGSKSDLEIMKAVAILAEFGIQSTLMHYLLVEQCMKQLRLSNLLILIFL